MKNILLTLIVFGLIGCATSNLYISEEPRMPNTKYGVWNYEIINDEFDGSFTVSSLKSENGNARIRLVHMQMDDINRFEYMNGDSYICTIYNALNVEFKFFSNAGDKILTFRLVTTRTRDRLQTDRLNEVHELLTWFHRSNKLIIRTTDDCGNSIDRTFRLSGTTHLLPRVRGESNVPVL